MSRTHDVISNKSLAAPSVTNEDLLAFYQAHFSQDALSSFGETFLNPTNEQQVQDEEWQEDDDLGYYDDGVKRTLTDEQIEIFRHSELEALRKQQEKRTSGNGLAPSDEAMDLGDATASMQSPKPDSSQKSHNIKKRKNKKVVKREPKPDLRKRTWDVVDKGLDSLDYD